MLVDDFLQLPMDPFPFDQKIVEFRLAEDANASLVPRIPPSFVLATGSAIPFVFSRTRWGRGVSKTAQQLQAACGFDPLLLFRYEKLGTVSERVRPGRDRPVFCPRGHVACSTR